VAVGVGGGETVEIVCYNSFSDESQEELGHPNPTERWNKQHRQP